MKCPKCQFENPDGMKFCGGCGTALEAVCPRCHFRNPPQFRFCGECGQDLREATEVPPIDYSQPHSYTPKFLAEKILTTRSSIEGERKLVTVLFADVASYTSISEKLDPEEVHQIMDGCFKILMDEIHRYEGTVNQFTGDGVMALFGAPVAHEDHAQRACHAALSIQKAISGYEERIKKDYGVEFQMRIGLNSGPVIVGAIGDDLRMDYTAVGDTTNLASRMQAMAHAGSVLVSRNTHRLVRDFFDFEPLGKVSVKGKEELQEAYELVRAGEVTTRFGAAQAKGLTRFVGRTNSMSSLMEAYEKVESGSGQVVGIVGEAGVGKSRLLLEFRNCLPSEGFTYLDGRCLHFGGAIAYLPILDILRSYFGIKEGEREFVIRRRMTETILQLDEKLKPILSPLQDLLSLKVEDEAYLKLEPKQRRERVFEAIRDLFIRESQEKPLVLAIEDLHWVDKTTEEFLDYLIGWLPKVRVLLILLHRPEYTHQWGSKSYFNRIGLDQLTLKSSAELVQAILEGGGVAPELRDLILKRAAGNPLFMEELTHSLLENGSIAKANNQYVLSRKASEIQVPDTIQGIIASRLDRLEENLKRIMQVASVIGREFAFRILHTITGLREDLKSSLLNLQGLEFIYEKSLFPELEYIFKHALTQEVAYQSLLVKRRKEIHEKIGQAIERIYEERLEEFYEMLAYHYSKGESSQKAYHYLTLSGDKAAKNYANWESIKFYKEAIQVLDSQPETEETKREKIDVYLSIMGPMFFLNYPEGTFEIIEEAERLSKELGDERSLATVYSRLGHYHTLKGNPTLGLEYSLRGMEYSEKCLDEEEKVEAIESIASILTDGCAAHAMAGDYVKVVGIARRVLSLLEEHHREKDLLVRGLNLYSGLSGYCGNVLACLGKFEEGKAALDKGFKNALEVNDKYTKGWVQLNFAGFSYFKGDGDNTIDHAQKAIKVVEETGVEIWLGFIRSLLGGGYYLLGEYETARDHAEKGLELQKERGISVFLPSIYSVLALIHLALGDLKSAKDCAEEALRLSQEFNAKAIEGCACMTLGSIVGKADPAHIDVAERDIRQGISILEELKAKGMYALGYLFLGELFADAGQREKALENLKKAEALYLEMKVTPKSHWLIRTQEALGRLQ